jgi:Secretion system C-terminal sorting domain
MNKIYILIAFFNCFSTIYSQKNADNIWLGGLNEYSGEAGNGNYMIRFDSGSPVVDSVNVKMNFESTVASICDSLGNLKYYSNGCQLNKVFGAGVYGATTYDGGNFSPINPGWIRDSSCPAIGYIAPRGMMMVEDAEKPQYLTSVFTMGMHYDEKWGLIYGPFNYSSIHPFSSAVPSPILPLILAPVAQVRRYEPFSVVRHGNGRNYWVIVPEYAKNKYHIFFVGLDYVMSIPDQEIGPIMKCDIGSTVFSPDGTKFARVHNCGVTVMNFDRCTGQLSNPIYLSRPTHTFGGGGAVFSPDAKKLIVSSQLAILEANLELPSPVLDTLIPASAILGNSLGLMQEGPDGNIYFSSMQRTRQMPVLKDPFGSSPVFYLLDLPVNSVRSIPHFPNFRLYDFSNSPCDTLGINTPVATVEIKPTKPEIFVQPNPANNFVDIIWKSTENIRPEWIEIIGLDGKIFYKNIVSPYSVHLTSIDLSNFSNGFYLINLKFNNQVLTKKLVIIH